MLILTDANLLIIKTGDLYLVGIIHRNKKILFNIFNPLCI